MHLAKRNKINVLFINLPYLPYDTILEKIRNEDKIAHRLEMPLGILYLSAYLKKHNHLCDIRLLDYSLHIDDIRTYSNIDNFIKSLAKKVDFVPDILAFSAMFSTSHRFFVETLDILKSLWPKVTTIAGGNHATNAVGKLLELENLDYVAIGEAEASFSEFVSQIAASKQINIKGIYAKKDIHSAASFSSPGYIEDLDSLPFPDWDLLNMAAYINSKGRKRNIGESKESRCATIMTSRGCPFCCTFCAAHTVHGRRVRYRSVENILEEVKLLYRAYEITLFIPEDDMFTQDKQRTLNLLSAFKELNIPGLELQFPNALSINTLSEEVLDALINSGMKVACLAIESGSEYVQKNVIKKNCNLKKAKEYVEYLGDKGTIVRCYYILGFPGETKEQMMETVEYAKYLNADWSVFSIATPLLGSEMYNQFLQMGCITGELYWGVNASYAKRNFDTKEITAEELNAFAYQANIDVNFIHNPNIVNGNFTRAIEIFNDIVIHFPFHIIAWHCLMRCYQGLGDIEKAKEITRKIAVLINSDKRSAEMFAKYGRLLPESSGEELLRI
ncbi:MAG: radical SAM protein [Candidatus Omnitrophica bacterium]|nr:radical SAM protein [Candidatus Omnitrophota bacterium]